MIKTLLQKAKDVPTKRWGAKAITDEHIELALAWLKGEIQLRQITETVGRGNVLYSVARWLREGYRKGKIIIK